MKNIIELNSRLFQTSIKIVSEGKLKVIIKQNKFTAGIINLYEKTFYNSPRTSKNLFRLFNGLGIGSELLNIVLPYFNISTIIVPYEGTELITTVDKWRRLGIVSPYCNENVDKQVVVSLKDITMNDVEKYRQTIKPQTQLTLFGAA